LNLKAQHLFQKNHFPKYIYGLQFFKQYFTCPYFVTQNLVFTPSAKHTYHHELELALVLKRS
jgi:2-keto-4-pentenoate hydratase/2-oxohepta-3-ene-1,7-dioic acid hydratase in catechol pathway